MVHNFFNSSPQKKNNISGEWGFTLIELIITITIIGIVFSIIYSSLLTDLTHFVRGEEDSSFLQSIHLATYLIENRVRNASEVELLDSYNSDFIIISFADDFLEIENETPGTKTKIPGIAAITFSKIAKNDDIDYLIINIESSKGESYESQLFLNNLVLHNKEITGDAGRQYQYLGYKK